jgi:MFS family permease
MQNGVEGVMRGRVMSIYVFLHQGAPAAGTLLIGGLAEHLGLTWPVAAAGVVTILVWAVMLPRLRGMKAALETVPPRSPQPAAGT